MFRVALALLLLVLTGCTAPAWQPFSWWTGRGERKAEQAATAAQAAQAKLLTHAQRATAETAEALQSVPPSRATEVATEASTQAGALLAQALGPLPAPEQAAIRAQIAALLSDNTQLRAEGENLRKAARQADAQASQELTALRAQLATAQAEAAQIARSNSELAARYLQARWIAAASVACTILATVAGIAWRLNLGGLQTGVANGLALLRSRHGFKDEDVEALAAEIDAQITPRQQATIAARAARALPTLLATHA